MTTMNLESDDADDEVMHTATEAKAVEDNPSIGHLRDEAMRRKRRLAKLRQKKSLRTSAIKADDDEAQDEEGEANEDAPLPKPIFRNYKPQSEDLKEGELPSAPMIDLTSLVTAQLEAASAPVIVEEVNLMNLAPRKPDWDLKRGVEKKLQKLERRTQRAIAELIRERLRETQPDLATAVNQQPAPFH